MANNLESRCCPKIYFKSLSYLNCLLTKLCLTKNPNQKTTSSDVVFIMLTGCLTIKIKSHCRAFLNPEPDYTAQANTEFAVPATDQAADEEATSPRYMHSPDLEVALE